MEGSSREKRPMPSPHLGPPLPPWQWLRQSMNTVGGSALWTSYFPMRPNRRRTKPATFIPAFTARRAEGVQWKKLIDFLGTQLDNDGCRKADVLVIFSDNRRPDAIQHWEYTSRILVERSKFVKTEQFYFIWVPATQEAGLDGRHYSWTIAAVAKALTCNPGLDDKHLLFLDHDVTLLTLFDINELVLESIQAYAGALNAIHAKGKCYPGILTVSEENLNHNGGILIFPAKQHSTTRSESQNILLGNEWVCNVINKTTTFLRNKPENLRDYWNARKTEIDLGKETALGMMRECLHQQQFSQDFRSTDPWRRKGRTLP